MRFVRRFTEYGSGLLGAQPGASSSREWLVCGQESSRKVTRSGGRKQGKHGQFRVCSGKRAVGELTLPIPFPRTTWQGPHEGCVPRLRDLTAFHSEFVLFLPIRPSEKWRKNFSTCTNDIAE